ncbi:serine O-acetyltransferase EpsC [Thermosipho atlanticus]|uniref:Serine acetyltransferase n=1 Tax=Thermosipho atlanticus DSM 15807 TaxID=1123380 RepID=A0A1M5TZH5_9BACT|nr:serine O-acetyltransferase EpsC [Thermosipho atlanticus]SHH56192.1 serine O-acetyltransferase [Thermosipho atlanticus DSM 15807]
MRNFINDLKDVFRAIKKDKEEYLKKDPSIEFKWQLIFHVGFLSLKLYRWSHLLYKHNMKFLAYLLHFVSRVLFAVDINPSAEIEPGVVIDHGIGTVIGSTVTIGTGTLIYHGVTLGSRNIQKGKRHPDIGRNVLIGSGAKILGAIKIGDGAQIGANSVVLHDVAPYTKVVGIPAKKVEQLTEIYEHIEWII